MSKYFFLAFVFLAGCASATKQTDTLLSEVNTLPAKVEIPNVPFINQEVGHCGPATLAMAMNWSGKNITVDELAPQVYTPGAKGSFQTDMISASRRNGMFAVTVTGLKPLLEEIAAGNPVIVFENLSVRWLPQWHYALVFGFDLNQQTVLMHSGPEQNKNWDMRKFERSWELGDYWGLVVLPPGKIAATAPELAQTNAASMLEQLGKIQEAELSYQAILKRWPESLGAQVGLANIAFSRGESAKAAKILEKATLAHPQSAAVWHNLAIAQGASRQVKLAKISASKALNLATPEQKPQFKQSLEAWLTP